MVIFPDPRMQSYANRFQMGNLPFLTLGEIGKRVPGLLHLQTNVMEFVF